LKNGGESLPASMRITTLRWQRTPTLSGVRHGTAPPHPVACDADAAVRSHAPLPKRCAVCICCAIVGGGWVVLRGQPLSQPQLSARTQFNSGLPRIRDRSSVAGHSLAFNNGEARSMRRGAGVSSRVARERRRYRREDDSIAESARVASRSNTMCTRPARAEMRAARHRALIES
jgi:hypothetical protein